MEILIVLVIVSVLIAIALPYYRNAVESSRITEAVLLWGRQKNFAQGYRFSEDTARQTNERLAAARLRYFTAQLVCRPKENPQELCWEVEFDPKDTHASMQYRLLTTHNFSRLACMGLNSAGNRFCESLSRQEPPDQIDGHNTYWVY